MGSNPSNPLQFKKMKQSLFCVIIYCQITLTILWNFVNILTTETQKKKKNTLKLFLKLCK